MSTLKSYPSLVHFLGAGFVARVRFCAVALLALLWVAQPANAQDLSGTTTPLPVTPGGDAVVVFPDLVVSDADANPVVMRVRVENPDDLNAGDTLAFSGTPNTSGIQVQFFPAAGIIGTSNDTLFGGFASGTPPGADRWQGLLRNLTFAAPAGSGGREIRLFVQVRYSLSGSDSSDTLTRTLNIGAAAANSPPTGLPTITGTPRVGRTLTANTSGISDADGPAVLPFTYQWNTHSGGTDTAISGANSATYTLTADEMGDQITVSVRYTDAGGEDEGPLTSAPTAAVTAASTPNTPPTPTGLGVSTNEDTAYTFAAGDFNFVDMDTDDSLQQVRIDSLPDSANGSLALSGTAVTAMQVIDVADIPNLVYTPVTNVNGTDSFTYSLSDGTDFFAPGRATAFVTITAVNDAPTTSNLTATIAEDNTHTFAVADFTFNDVDSGDTLQAVRIDSLPDSTSGSLTLSGTAVTATQVIPVAGIPTLVYTPALNVNGPATFTFSVSDGDDFSATATATVTVTAVNDAPTISGTPATSVVQGGTYSFTPGGGDVDTGDTLLYAISSLPDWADFDTATGALTNKTGRPNSGDVGDHENIVITVTDGIITTPVALSAFNIEVTAPNTPPTADAGPFQRVSKGTEVTLNGTGSNDPDGDNSALTYLWERTAGPTEVTLSSTTVAQPTFTIPTVISTNPASYTFRLTVNDGQASSAPATVRIFIRPLFQATIANQNFTAGDAITPVTLPEARDGPDSLPSTNTYTLTPLPAGLAFDATSRTLSGTPTQAGIFNLTYTATNEFSDTDSLSFSITVNSAANNPPTTSGLAVSTNEDIAHTFAAAQFNFADTDSGDTLQQVRIDTLPDSANGSLALGTGTSATPVNTAQVIAVAAIPNLVYTPATNVNGEATFTFSVSDGTDFSATPATATVTVNPVNDAPSGLPTITGTPRVGNTLTANTSGITDPDGLTNTTFTYQWLENGGSLSGETSPTLALTSANDVGADIEVRVSFTDDDGNDERLTSQAVSVLAAISETVSIAGPTGNVNEGDDATFTVTLSGSPGAAVVVDYATAAGTATAGSDFTTTSGTLTFAANTTDLSQTFDVPVTTDSLVEGSETFTATLSANASNPLPTGFSLGTATATATIGAAGTATVSIAGPTGNVNEGDDATFTVTLSGSPGAAVVVDYATAIGTASATDFSDTSGTLTFAANTTTLSQTFDVPVLTDSFVEGSETFTATLSANASNPLPTGFSLGTATATATIGAAGTATVSIAGPTGNVNEGDDATFTVTLSDSPGAAVVVDYATAIGTASATDFSDTSGTLTFAANTTTLSQTFTVPVTTDSLVEGSESFTATLSANASTPLPTGFSLGTATATATIGATGSATVSISGGGNVNEGDNATFTVTLSGSPGAAVMVDYATAAGTATAGSDFTATNGTLTFAANTTTLSQTFDVPVLTDSLVEGSESFTATLSANASNPLPTGFSLGTATATATIGAAGSATVSISGGGNVNEGDDATFTVTLSGSPGAAVLVDYTTAIGTASATDFSDTSGTLTFAANTTTLTQTFTVPVLTDSLVEGSESFTATLSANASNPLPTGFSLGTATATATIGATGSATVSISGGGNVNEGDNATFTVTLSGSPGAAVLVDYATAAGTATAGSDFTETTGTLTFAANTTDLSQTFTVPVLTDSLVEGEESFTATLSASSTSPLPTGFSLGTATATATIGATGSATVSISGGGNVNEGDDATFTVTLSGSPGAAVVVDYTTAAGTASATDFTETTGTLTFAANTTDLSQTFDVPVLTDSFVEGDESFTATLSANASNPLPTGFSLGTATAQATITAAGSATVSISGGGNVNEGDDATFTVTLSGSPGAAVVVDYATAAGTATAGSDFTETTGTLTFAANTTDLSQTFTVPVLTDSIVEGSESFTAVLSANASTPLPTGFSLGTATAQATITAAGSATVSISGGGNVNEGDDATFTVTLSGSPGAAVVVDYATAAGTATAGSDFTETNGTLTFAANTTDLSQTFTVPVTTDSLVEGSETFTATLSANASTPLPTGFSLGTATATATIGAAGSATVSISGGGNVNEGDDATFTVTLSGSPGAAVLVDYTTAIGTASATDFSDTSGTLTFAANTTTLTQTFTVPVLTDSLVEGSESFTATLSANASNPLPTGFSLGTATATATIGAAGSATVSISGGGNVNEGDDATFTVTLSGSPGAAVLVDYTTAIGTASATDFSDTSGTLTFAANTTTLTQTFTVPVLTDSLVEGSESFTATLSANASNPLPTGFSLGTATATATIGAAGSATVSISGGGNVNEGDDATFTVTLSGSPGAAVLVDYTTAIGTASATDFSDTSGTLTFTAGVTGTDLTQTFDVPVLTDSFVEGSESFTATLSANASNPLPTGFNLGTATATATIGAAGSATVSISGGGNVNEGDNATFTVTLSGSPGAAVVVDYATAAGTATAGSDFTATNGTLTFAAGATGTDLSQTFDVPVLTDSFVEGSESFTATLSANASNPLPTGFTLGTTSAQVAITAAGSATVSISGGGNVNEGDDATFTVTLSGSPGAAVVVDYATAAGTAIPGSDFTARSGTLTFAANTTTLSQTFTVPVTTDSLVEGSETFTATLSASSTSPLPTGFSLGTTSAQVAITAAGSATVSISGGGNVNEGDNATFTVTLSGSPGAAVMVDYATAAGTATAGSDFTARSGTLTFAAGATGDDLRQTFTVPVTTDSLVEGSETFTAVLSANASNPLPTGFTLGTTSAQVAITAAGSATVSISGGGNVNEGDDATFTVTLSGSPGAAVVVDYATAAGTATAGSDFTETTGTLTFAAGATGTALTQTFPVPVTDDSLTEGDETFTATLSANTNSPLPAGVALGTTTAQATIAASDAPVPPPGPAPGPSAPPPGVPDADEAEALGLEPASTNSAGTAITLPASEEVDVSNASPADFTVTSTLNGVTTDHDVTAIRAGSIILDVTPPIPAGADIEVSYRPALGSITSTATGEELASFMSLSVANTVPAQVAPVANAGEPQTVAEGATVTLNGSATDPDSDAADLSYAWTQTSGQQVTLSGADSPSPSFTAPTGLSADAVLVFSLTVSDGRLSASDSVNITVTNVNDAPSADAGENQSVDEGATVTLSGSGTDPDTGDSLSYTWTQTSGQDVTLSGADSPSASFTAPTELGVDAVLGFSLTVSDGRLSASASVNVTVTAVNKAPSADAGTDQSVDEGAAVTLSGSGTDPDPGDTESLSYAWIQTGGPTVSLSRANSASPSFTAPNALDTDTVLTFRLTVTDPRGASGSDSVQVTVETNVAARQQALELNLAAFGRSVAASAVDAIGERLKPASAGPQTSTVSGLSLAACLSSITNLISADTVTANSDSTADSADSTTTADSTVSTNTASAHTASANTVSASTAGLGDLGSTGNLGNSGNLGNPGDSMGGLNRASTDRQSDNPVGNACQLPDREQLARSAFVIPLGLNQNLSQNLSENHSTAEPSAQWSLWGRGDFSHFEGSPQSDFDLDGEVVSGYLGLDYRLETGALVGVALSHSSGETDYRSGETDGELETDLSSVYPYGYWSPRDGLGLWGLLGIGQGDATLSHGATTFETDLDMRLGALGLRQALHSTGEFELALKADAFIVELESEDVPGLPEVTAQARRARLLLEASRHWQVQQPEASLSTSLELGVRVDGGDAEEGEGAEVGVGLEYANGRGLSTALRAHGLLAHKESDFEAWGASLTVQLDLGVSGQGLALTLTPVWGQDSGGGAQALWESERALQDSGLAQRPTARLELNLSYGLVQSDRLTRLRPFAQLDMADGIARRLRLGMQLERPDGLELEVFAGRNASEQRAPEHLLGLSGRLHF